DGVRQGEMPQQRRVSTSNQHAFIPTRFKLCLYAWAAFAAGVLLAQRVSLLTPTQNHAGLDAINLILITSVLLVTIFAVVDAARNEQTDRTLSSNVMLANERLRLALEAGKAVGWDWNVTTGRDVWFGDLQTLFGIPEDTYVGHVDDFRRRVHPDD